MQSSISVPIIAVLFLCLNSPQSTTALDLNCAKEMKCFFPNTTQIDLNWMFSAPQLYFPVSSRYALYSIAAITHGQPAEEIEEDMLYYKSCLTSNCNKNLNKCTLHGFQGHSFPMDVSFSSNPGVIHYSRNGQDVATCYSLLTDNRTFILKACCLPDNDFGWDVLSITPYLSNGTLDKIHNTVKMLGFNPNQFTGLRYELC